MGKSNRKIGIMGGTFDPIHNGHLIIAENATEQFSLDKVYFIPTGLSPHKKDKLITSAEHRCNMISLAIEDNTNFSLSLLEIQSREVNYTHKTLEKLKFAEPNTDFYFILGADSLFSIENWASPEQILKNCTVLVAGREHPDVEKLDTHIFYLCNRYNASIYRLYTPNFDVSSHDIRERVAQHTSIRYMVPLEVESYIAKNNLYISLIS
ncbi:nicotinate-nucleotide adenylyltransferase [Lachnospiraceae bacterium ZAX-1]